MISEEEYPLKFLLSATPGTLISIASSKVAQLCWSHRLNHMYPDEIVRPNFHSLMRLDMFSCIEKFQVPGRIRALINHHIKLMADDLEGWWFQHDRLFDDCYDVLSKHFLFFVLNSNGNIGYKATARHILTYGKLSLVVKFRICCAYCMENDIEKLWPSVSEGDCFKYMNFYENPTLYYWICRMKNELDKIPVPEGQSTESSVVEASIDANECMEIGFFWDKLNETQQCYVIEFSISMGVSINCVSTLNKSQLDKALQDSYFSFVTLCYSLVSDKNNNSVFLLWNYLKNQIRGYEFGSILRDLFQLIFIRMKYYFNYAADLIYDVWSTAPDHLKAYVMETYYEYYFKNLPGPHDNHDMRWYGRDMKFHLEILSNAKALSKHRTLWLENWRKVMLIATPTVFEKFLKIWADNEEEIESFKASMMNYSALSKYFDKFIETGLSNELIDYLKFCSSDEETVRIVMKEIIVSNLNRLHKFERFDTMVNFKNFIDKAFPTPDLAEKFKKEKIRDRLKNWYELLNENHLNGVRNIFECYFSSDVDLLVKIKRRCFEKCKRILSTGSFKKFQMREWDEFLTWCDASEKEMAKFKKTLPIDDVFSVLLTSAIKLAEGIINWPSLTNLNSFLLWYFESSEATSTFKFNKIYDYKQIDSLHDILKNGGSQTVDDILNWFFVRKEQEKEKFEEILAMERDDGWETVEEEDVEDDLELESDES